MPMPYTTNRISPVKSKEFQSKEISSVDLVAHDLITWGIRADATIAEPAKPTISMFIMIFTLANKKILFPITRFYTNKLQIIRTK